MGLKSAKYFFKVLLSNTCIHSRTELASISPLWQSLRFQMVFQIMQERRWACLTNCCRRECAPNLSKWDCNVGRGGVGNHTCSLCEKEQEGAYRPDDHTSLQWRGKLTWHNGTLERKNTDSNEIKFQGQLKPSVPRKHLLVSGSHGNKLISWSENAILGRSSESAFCELVQNCNREKQMTNL